MPRHGDVHARNLIKFTCMNKDPKKLAGLFEEEYLEKKAPEAIPAQKLGGEVWYQ